MRSHYTLFQPGNSALTPAEEKSNQFAAFLNRLEAQLEQLETKESSSIPSRIGKAVCSLLSLAIAGGSSFGFYRGFKTYQSAKDPNDPSKPNPSCNDSCGLTASRGLYVMIPTLIIALCTMGCCIAAMCACASKYSDEDKIADLPEPMRADVYTFLNTQPEAERSALQLVTMGDLRRYCSSNIIMQHEMDLESGSNQIPMTISNR